jgi:hypothetical protein
MRYLLILKLLEVKVHLLLRELHLLKVLQPRERKLNLKSYPKRKKKRTSVSYLSLTSTLTMRFVTSSSTSRVIVSSISLVTTSFSKLASVARKRKSS